MSQERFQAQNQASWDRLSQAFDALENRRPVEDAASLPRAYRRLATQLALARHRGYSAGLVGWLNLLALRGHRALYTQTPSGLSSFTRLIAFDIPRAVRGEGWRLAAAAALFLGPLLGAYAAVALAPELVYSLLDPAAVVNLERMYDPSSEHFARERAADSDFLMFGFYIRNNIGIAFRTYAGGLLLGVGVVFFLVFNGILAGAAAAHLQGIGYGSTFFPFVVGHSAFELTALVISGAAGLRLGGALLAPGRRTRASALAEEARAGLHTVYGFALMLVAAALVEAFWSPRAAVPGSAKLAVGAVLWTVVALWLSLGGRRRGA